MRKLWSYQNCVCRELSNFCPTWTLFAKSEATLVVPEFSFLGVRQLLSLHSFFLLLLLGVRQLLSHQNSLCWEWGNSCPNRALFAMSEATLFLPELCLPRVWHILSLLSFIFQKWGNFCPIRTLFAGSEATLVLADWGHLPATLSLLAPTTPSNSPSLWLQVGIANIILNNN